MGDSLLHVVSHGSVSSTSISPTGGSVLAGSTVTFSWIYTGGGGSGPDVAYKYTGKERDNSTGLYFYEARYYDAALGRFISADTIVPSATDSEALNRYSYARNNPIIFTDPSGHFFKKIKKAFKKVEKFSFDNRAYITLGGSIPGDWLLKNESIGPFVSIVGTAVAGYYGGPFAAAGAQAYYTRLMGGSVEDAAVAAGVGLVSSYAGGVVGGYASTEIGGGAFGAIVGGAVGGAASGALGAALTGGDPAKGALYGAAAGAGFAAASIGESAVVQAVNNYYANLNVIASQQLRVDRGAIGGGGDLIAQACTSPSCTVNGQIVGIDNTTGDYLLDIQLNGGEAGPINVEIIGRRVLSGQGAYEGRLGSTSLGTVNVPLQNGPVRIPPPTVPYGKSPNIQQGDGNYLDLRHNGQSNFRVPGWRNK